MAREGFNDLLLQHAPQINNLFHRLKVDEGDQIAFFGIDIDIGFQAELLQHIAQGSTRNLESFG
ncbi:hypothetical protein D3C73_1252370 [compost metagenome]